jgi:hypothetical protein
VQITSATGAATGVGAAFLTDSTKAAELPAVTQHRGRSAIGNDLKGCRPRP